MSVTVYPTDRGHVVSVTYPEEDKAYIEASFHAFSFQSDLDFEEAISEFILMNPYNTFIFSRSLATIQFKTEGNHISAGSRA